MLERNGKCHDIFFERRCNDTGIKYKSKKHFVITDVKLYVTGNGDNVLLNKY